MNLFISHLFKDPLYFLLSLTAVVFSICLHEYCHARTALACGDSTAADRGHLTLNPLKQMGPVSIIMLLFIGLAWGSVPVNPYNMTKKGRVLTSLAGPAANLLLFLTAWMVLFLLVFFRIQSTALRIPVLFVYVFGYMNSLLFFLNILPVPGFDGWNVLREFVPVRDVRSDWGKGIIIFVIFLLIMGIDFLASAARFLMNTAITAGGRI